jgi:hypothetical protein
VGPSPSCALCGVQSLSRDTCRCNNNIIEHGQDAATISRESELESKADLAPAAAFGRGGAGSSAAQRKQSKDGVKQDTSTNRMEVHRTNL